jgi:hypothetical protein
LAAHRTVVILRVEATGSRTRMRRVSRRSPESAPAGGRAADVLVGLPLLLAVIWLGTWGWRFYGESLLPQARAVPTATPTPVADPEGDRLRARVQRQVTDHVGAGIALRQAGQRDAALAEFNRAITLDPANFEARQNLREMGVEPPPGTIVNTPVPPAPTPLASVTPRS